MADKEKSKEVKKDEKPPYDYLAERQKRLKDKK